MHSILRQMGLIGNKRIPVEYQRSSANNGSKLLQGLMDTDGTLLPSRACRTDADQEDLARDAVAVGPVFGLQATSWSQRRSSTE